MPKQYTFKTTKDTEWMEEILDGIDSSSRSKFIRRCIIFCLKNEISDDELRKVDTKLNVGSSSVEPTIINDIPSLNIEGIECEISVKCSILGREDTNG